MTFTDINVVTFPEHSDQLKKRSHDPIGNRTRMNRIKVIKFSLKKKHVEKFYINEKNIKALKPTSYQNLL